MKIVGIMAARNEDWVLGLTARAALMWLDALVILDHASTDKTAAIIEAVGEEHPERVAYDFEPDPVWKEMEHRQRMLDTARRLEATHICYIDADEILTGDLLGMEGERNWDGAIPIRSLLRGIPGGAILQLPWLAMRGSIGQVHTSGPWAEGQVASFGFLDDPSLHWSSEKRGGYDFHHRQPMGKPLAAWTPLGPAFLPQCRQSGLMHLQYLSGRRLRAKQSKYKCDEVLRWPGRESDQIKAVNERYNLAVYGEAQPNSGWWKRLQATLGPADLEAWWGPYKHLMHHLKISGVPWQEAEVKSMIAAHPQELAGLDLFGLEDPPSYRHD